MQVTITGDVATYQSALVAALDDEIISEDEWAMLTALRTIVGIQREPTCYDRRGHTCDGRY